MEKDGRREIKVREAGEQVREVGGSGPPVPKPPPPPHNLIFSIENFSPNTFSNPLVFKVCKLICLNYCKLTVPLPCSTGV